MDHLAAALLVLVASPSDRLQSSRPKGYADQGHAENHAHYKDLKNKQNGSCCNGHDCRPTTARWNNKSGMWEALVNGAWHAISNANLVLDDAWLEAQGHPRWDSQAHVCASDYPRSDGTYTVWCLIPPGSGQ